jgi:hypothetical protein
MTPHERLEVMLYEDVLKARVGDIIATLRRSGRQHALVVDTDSATRLPGIRGIFSTTQIARQIGAEITLPGHAANFAELGAALGA